MKTVIVFVCGIPFVWLLWRSLNTPRMSYRTRRLVEQHRGTVAWLDEKAARRLLNR